MSVMQAAMTERFAHDTASGLFALMFAGINASQPYGLGGYYNYDVPNVVTDSAAQGLGLAGGAAAVKYNFYTANSFLQIMAPALPAHNAFGWIDLWSLDANLARQLVRVAIDLAARQTEMDPGARRVLYGRMRELIRR